MGAVGALVLAGALWGAQAQALDPEDTDNDVSLIRLGPDGESFVVGVHVGTEDFTGNVANLPALGVNVGGRPLDISVLDQALTNGLELQVDVVASLATGPGGTNGGAVGLTVGGQRYELGSADLLP